MAREDDPSTWSNAKKARTFAHLLSHLAVKLGSPAGELRISKKEIEKFRPVGFAIDGDDYLIVVDMDDVG